MFRRPSQLAPALRSVHAGRFLIGSTPAQVEAVAQPGADLEVYLAETPQQKIELDSFEISRGPVSCADYDVFVTATDHTPPAYWGGYTPPAALRDHPVVEISFNDARAYCRWLSTATSRTFRLPTEQQWEAAARGQDGRIFPWGDEWQPGQCNVAEDGPGTTTPIGSYDDDTSPYGCVDLAGNVAEWTVTPAQLYAGSSRSEPLASGIIVRGGSWSARYTESRAAYRVSVAPTTTSLALGFRVICLDE